MRRAGHIPAVGASGPQDAAGSHGTGVWPRHGCSLSLGGKVAAPGAASRVAATVPPVTDPEPSPQSSVRRVQYKGEPLDAERGPGLGCFRFQLVLLVIAIVLTPLSVFWHWPETVSAALLFLTIALLLVAGQTIIFLLRLVAADRRAARRRPLASQTRTVGELEDEARDEVRAEPGDASPEPENPPSDDQDAVRQ